MRVRPLIGPSFRRATIVTFASLFAAFVFAGCGGDDDDTSNGDGADPTEGANDGADSPAPTAETSGGDDGAGRTGTITIGDETWTIVPAIQCGVYIDTGEAPDQIYISGHAAEGESIEIALDYDPDLVSARVQGEDDDPYWTASDESGLTFEPDGRTVRGSGTFRDFTTGEEAEGSFEITC